MLKFDDAILRINMGFRWLRVLIHPGILSHQFFYNRVFVGISIFKPSSTKVMLYERSYDIT